MAARTARSASGCEDGPKAVAAARVRDINHEGQKEEGKSPDGQGERRGRG